jgi:TPR repeat protein
MVAGTDIWANEPDLLGLRKAWETMQADPGRAIPLLHDLASRGSPMSMVYLGTMARKGLAGDKNVAEAELWYRRAMSLGSIVAVSVLGGIYFNRGENEAARECFAVGAAVDHAQSLYWLARCELRLAQGPSDVDEAVGHLERAVQGGHLLAKRELAAILIRRGRCLRGAMMFAQTPFEAFREALRDPKSDRLN